MTTEDILSDLRSDLDLIRRATEPEDPLTLKEFEQVSMRLKEDVTLITREITCLDTRISRLKNINKFAVLIQRGQEEKKVLKEARSIIEQAIPQPGRRIFWRVEG